MAHASFGETLRLRARCTPEIAQMARVAVTDPALYGITLQTFVVDTLVGGDPLVVDCDIVFSVRIAEKRPQSELPPRERAIERLRTAIRKHCERVSEAPPIDAPWLECCETLAPAEHFTGKRAQLAGSCLMCEFYHDACTC